MAVLIATLLPVPRPTAPVAHNPTIPDNLAISDKGHSEFGQTVRHGSNPESNPTPQLARRQSREPQSDRVPYYDLPHRAAGALDQITLFVLPGKTTPQMPTQEPPAQGAPGWINDFEHRLKPIGRSLGDAFDFLWRAGESVDG
jgi:hypothetical protein